MVRPHVTEIGTGTGTLGKAVVTGIGVGTTAVIDIEIVKEVAVGTAVGTGVGTGVGIEIAEIAEIERTAGVSTNNKPLHL